MKFNKYGIATPIKSKYDWDDLYFDLSPHEQYMQTRQSMVKWTLKNEI